MNDKEYIFKLLKELYPTEIEDTLETVADYLVEHGVMIEKWISVTDELPKQYKTVIVWTKFKEIGEAEYDGKHFVWMDDDGCYDIAFATHWMSLPEPPKEVN